MLTKQQQSYRIMIFTIILLLCGVLGGVVISLLLSGSPSAIMSQIGLQRTRGQRLTKDAILLIKDPQDIGVAHVVGEMQAVIPLWEQTEAALQGGNITPSASGAAGLPVSPPLSVQLLANQLYPDYNAMDRAFKYIVVHPTEKSTLMSLQLQIILAHETSYYYEIGQINTIWGTGLDSSLIVLRQIEIGAILAIIVTAVLGFILVSRTGRIHPSKKE